VGRAIPQHDSPIMCVQMALSIFRFLLPYLIFAVLAASGAMALYSYHPTLLALADSLLTDHEVRISS